MEVDPAKRRILIEERKTVGRERLRDFIRILLLPGKVEPGHHARVLIEAGALGQSTQSAFNLPNTSLKLLVGQTLLVQSG